MQSMDGASAPMGKRGEMPNRKFGVIAWALGCAFLVATIVEWIVSGEFPAAELALTVAWMAWGDVNLSARPRISSPPSACGDLTAAERELIERLNRRGIDRQAEADHG